MESFIKNQQQQVAKSKRHKMFAKSRPHPLQDGERERKIYFLERERERERTLKFYIFCSNRTF